MNSGIGIVDAATILESSVGAALVVAARQRVVAIAGLAMALVFVSLGVWTGGSECGCFGDLRVPGGLKWTLICMGALACASFLRRGRAPARARRVPWLRFAGAAALAAAGTLPIASREPLGPSAGARLGRVLGVHGGARTLVVVGAWSCPACKRALEALAARSMDDEQRGLRVVFAHRASDKVPKGRDLRGVVPRAIPDSLWWSFVRHDPPAFVRLKGDGTFVLEASLDKAVRRS